MQKIWVCGSNGQIGTAINQMVDKFEYEMLNTNIDDLDVTDLDEVINFGEINRPDVITNCSGLNDIDYCEEKPKEAYRVNALGARNLSIIASKVSAKLVQCSTDDIFDGLKNEPYTEFDEPNPLTVYGKSKLAGENYVKEFTFKHFIIRSTWVYGEGKNFVLDLIKKAKAGEVLSIAADHYGSPTYANDLANFILHLIKTNEYGTYHATDKGECSRFQFAKEILMLTGIDAHIKAVPTTQSDFSSVRPTNAVLDDFIMSIIDIYEFPDWKISLADFIKKRGNLNE